MPNECCGLCERGLLAQLSHELRNPLAALSNGLYVLMKCQTGDARVARALVLMERQLRQMTSLVDNLTAVATLGREGMVLHPTEVDLVRLVRDACHDFDYLFVAREIDLRMELPEDTLLIWADATRLTQVMGNLLQNAAQFTPPGGEVVVGLELNRAEKRARLCLRDTGIGFDVELRQRLFHPNIRGVTAQEHTRGGLGLGLVLVKGVVDLHGGAVWAESAGPGLGSTFVVELPWPGLQRPEMPTTEANSV